MNRAPLAERIVKSFDSLPDQLGMAARYVIDNPEDVALLSMREQARRAGVRPWTMTRLARRLGYHGYSDIRAERAEAVRGGLLGFAGKAGIQVERQRQGGEEALAADIAASIAAQAGRLGEAETLASLIAAARAMAGAKRVYCLGHRSSRAVAAQIAYMMSFLGDKAVMTGHDSGGIDAIRHAGKDDVLLAVSVAPYTRATVEAAHFAAQRGVRVIALTDSPVSPLAALAAQTIAVGTESPSFFHTMAPAFLAGEILVALVAGQDGQAALDAIARTESELGTLNIHLHAPPDRKQA